MTVAAVLGSDAVAAGVRRVLWVTLLLNLAVSAAKVVVGKLSGSLSMVADGYHSLMDGSNNVVGLVVAHLAYQPPDEGHPYGHRKFETAATLLIGLALLALAYKVAAEALGLGPSAHPPLIGPLSWIVMLGTLAVNVFVASYEARRGRELGSAYLIADSAHTRSDVVVTTGVIGSFLATRAGLLWADRAVAVGIAAFVALLAGRVLVGAFHALTDRAMIPVDALTRVVLGVPGVRQCRGIRTRGVPNAVFVDLVVHVDGSLTLTAAHAVADRIEAELMSSHPEIVDVVVHLEPAEAP